MRALGADFGGAAALDFGCGAGRLTQALGGYFGHALGVDISSSMVEAAERLNRKTGSVSFKVNRRADLSLFPDASFDFVLSLITLQHIPPHLAASYVRDFIRVLRPGGVAVFQVPSGAVGMTRLAVRLLPARVRALRRGMQMHSLSERQVRRLVERARGRVLRTEDDHMTGPRWHSVRYYAQRFG